MLVEKIMMPVTHRLDVIGMISINRDFLGRPSFDVNLDPGLFRPHFVP